MILGPQGLCASATAPSPRPGRRPGQLGPGDGPRCPVLTALHPTWNLPLQFHLAAPAASPSALHGVLLAVQLEGPFRSKSCPCRCHGYPSEDPSAWELEPELAAGHPRGVVAVPPPIRQTSLSCWRPRRAAADSAGPHWSPVKAQCVRDFVGQPHGFQSYRAKSNGTRERMERALADTERRSLDLS